HFVGLLFDQPKLQIHTSPAGWVERSEPQHAPDTETKLILLQITLLGFSSINPSYKTTQRFHSHGASVGNLLFLVRILQ
ncbi:MAG: hypothetical protein ACI9T9_001254, partial [Oleiphilaceae bacterium]